MLLVPLSASTSKGGVRFTLKYSKGFPKCIKFGAERYTAEKLSIIMSNLDLTSYRIVYDKHENALRLISDPQGPVYLPIRGDLTLEGTETEPIDYIKYSGCKNFMSRRKEVFTIYIPLKPVKK